ncbi:MAG: tRNA(Ile)-lysidine synthase [Candidatus Izimaplasma bacterium HR2]|nr:MAG: tRNA(Ile)-lysidine synthase [Candidatus Izimaplasma bacterium HR2]
MNIDLRKYIENKKIFDKNETIVLALSGGVDSMVLFDILMNINLNLKVILAHVNHNKREESKMEYEMLKKLANTNNIPFEGYEVEINDNSNFHDDSRNQRYAFFKVVAQKHKASKIVVAHHLDDQVETIIMRLIRGTSFIGYAGIPSVRRDRNISIVRPLMKVSKKDIRDYARDHEIMYYEDLSNNEDFYTRNRYRNKIIPLLRIENPNLNERILQFRDYIESADVVLDRIKNVFIEKNCVYNTVNLDQFNKLERIIKIKVLTHIINTATNNTLEIKYEQYNSILKLCLSNNPNQSYSLGDNYTFRKEYDYIYIEKDMPFVKINLEINECGEYFISDNHSFIFSDNKIEHKYTNYFELCYNSVVFPLYLRNRKNGDKIKLKVGTKKIKDILIDQKVPQSKRDKLLLVSNKEFVLWIPGTKKSLQSESCNKKLYIYEVK